jgi:hypothetical protein
MRGAGLPLATLDDLTIDGPVEERGATGGTSRWTLLVIGLIVAIAGFGYVARDAGPAPACVAATPTGPVASVPVATAGEVGLRLEQPIEGGAIRGSDIVVRGVADRPLGRVHIAAIAGTSEVGTTDTIVTAAGPFTASLSMIEPAWRVGVELRISATNGDGSTATLATRTVVSEPRPGVGLTRVAARRTRDQLVLSIDGVADARLQAIELRLLAADGTELAAVAPTLGSAEGWGGVMLASRPLRARVTAKTIAPGTPLYLVLSWLDPVTGDPETASQPMSVPLPSSHPDAMRPAGS